MVAKIRVSGSLAGAVNYNMNKLKADTAQILLTNKMLCPQQDEVFKASDMMKDFELFMPQRYRTENPVVREVMGKYHFLTFTEYKAVLTKFNIASEEVKGSHYGNSYSGIVYSATDNDDNKVGNPFSAATLGKFAGSEALERKYRTSKEYLEKSRPGAPLKRTINQAFAGATNKEQLRYNLFQSGIGVVYRENAAGRLYGVTFIDHNTGVVLNGSRLGKEYAANAIVDRFENPHQYEHLTNAAQSQGDV